MCTDTCKKTSLLHFPGEVLRGGGGGGGKEGYVLFSIS